MLSSINLAAEPSANMLYWNHFCYRDMWVFQLNDPPFNLLRLRHWEELNALLHICEREIKQSGAPRGLVLAGSKKMFSAGSGYRPSGLEENLATTLQQVKASTTELLQKLSHAIPVVAALSGYTVGEAWEVAAQCSLRVMGDNAYIAFSHNTPYIDAVEAQKRGLVDEIVGPDYVLARAQECVTEQSEHSPDDVSVGLN